MKERDPENSEPLTDGFNFTPLFRPLPRREEHSFIRVQMRIPELELAALPSRGSGFRGIVTDIDTGKKYRVYGHPCGLGCHCDAIIEEFK